MKRCTLNHLERLNRLGSTLSRPGRSRARLLSLAVFLVFVACGDDTVTEPAEHVPTFSLEKAAANNGDLQSDTVLATLEPFRIVVRVDETPAPGLQVFWVITADGIAETATTITDATGTASFALTFTTKPLAYTVQATLRKTAAGPSTTFTVNSTAGRATAIRIAAGENQTDTVTAQLGTAYVVQATDAYGNRVAGAKIDWLVTAGGGSVSPAQSTTDSRGEASARHTLGPTIGGNEVTVSTLGISTPVVFRATGTAAKAARLTMVSGNNQSAEANRALAADYVVRVTDSYGNVVVGAVVEWSITSGGGSLSSIQSVTGPEGTAAIKLTLGPAAGPQEVTAKVKESPGASHVVFTSTATTPPSSPPLPPTQPPGPIPPSAPPQEIGFLRVSISTTGVDLDNAVQVSAQSCANYPTSCSGYSESRIVASNSSVTFALPPGVYKVSLSNVAVNCAATQNFVPGTVNGSATTSDVSFTVTCVPKTALRISVNASGTDIPSAYSLQLDGKSAGELSGSSGLLIEVSAGSHTVALPYLPSNCAVAGGSTVTVTAEPGATTNVVFSVSCLQNPRLRVTVTATGPAPSSFYIGVDLNDSDFYTYSFNVPLNGSATRSIPAGSHVVTLDYLPNNCSVSGAESVSVALTNTNTTDVAFTVVCR